MTTYSSFDAIDRAFAPIMGKPAWCVRKGHGSFLTLEFGLPQLVIREPIVTQPERDNDRVHKLLGRRIVKPRGEWHLSIYCCGWIVRGDGSEVAHNESSDEMIGTAAKEIDGSLLKSVEANPVSGTSLFRFDQGVTLETQPYNEDGDVQWLLYMKSRKVFQYRADGRYWSWK